ncbi:MAG: peptide chain release factor N(5)-glutamine methyltransferase [Pseudomonadota bacterium]
MIDIQTGLRDLTDYLAQDDLPDPARDARVILGYVLKLSPTALSACLRDPLQEYHLEAAYALAAERTARRPMSHILGYRDFYKHRFLVTPQVLDPRPETETLVSLALEEPFQEPLELGIGSGCILLSLLAERPGIFGIGVDLSEAALEVADRNAKALGLSDRVHLDQSDWFSAVSGTYDLIVANPPYVSAEDYEDLAPELYHEPKIALTPGGDGLDAYRVICRDAPRHLAPGGRLIVEIGFDQGPAVQQLFAEAGLASITCHTDINAKDRVVSGWRA